MNVEEAWRLLRARLEAKDADKRYLDSARAVFAAGVYAASHDVLMRGATATQLALAAERIDRS